MTPSDLESPAVDRYVIDEYLAEGGMGAIFLGKKLGLEGFEKQVVLKQLLPEFTVQQEFIDLFLREAKLSASLDHANIVHTLDLVAAGEDYFIVMEYVRGGDLRTLLRRIKQRRQRLSPAAALFVAREVLSALAYAHEKRRPDGTALGLIHRDISPSNIMLSVAGEVKLTDFGIAKATTHTSIFYRVKGKVGYMSPEQAYGDAPLDQRSDLYSLAVSLYEMLAGERLFVADMLSTPEQIYAQPVKPLEDQPGMPPGTDAMLARALGSDPGQRYQTALEFQDALVQLAFDSALLFSSRDLADHLLDICGQDPSTWSLEAKERASSGTELLDQQEAARDPLGEGSAPFTGVAFTSVFSEEMARDLGMPPPPPDEVDPRRVDFQPTPPLAAPADPGQFTRSLGPPGPGGPAPRPLDPQPTGPMRPPPGPAPAPPPARPPASTDQVRPLSLTDRPPASQTPRSAPRGGLRHYLPVASLMLIALTVGVVVGLSGPDLSSSPPPTLPAPTPAALPGPDLETADAGTSSDAPPYPDLPAALPADPGAAPDLGDLQHTLGVRSTPAGATVHLDGVLQCKAPCAVKDLAAGKVYLLSVRRAGYLAWSSLVAMEGRAGVQLSAYLTPAPTRRGTVGWLQVTTRTPADIYIDGKQVGHVSSQGSYPLRPGEYEVALSHPKKSRRPRHLVQITVGKTAALRDNF